MENTYTNVNLGERYRDLRKDRKLTQEDLGNYLGLTRSAVNSWEMGLSIPSVSILISLSKFYGVTTDYLLGLDSSDVIDVSNLSPEDRVIIHDLIKRLSIPIKKTKKETTMIRENTGNLFRGGIVVTEKTDDEE